MVIGQAALSNGDSPEVKGLGLRKAPRRAM
jgi:hypothetical protein